jgi:phenylpropionate dioxygenase-like ring-hydroxylating dioxygenase large terminal subunit
MSLRDKDSLLNSRLQDLFGGAAATDILDLIVDQSTCGMQVIRGSVISAVRANWKLVIDNSGDGYHGRRCIRRSWPT